MALIIDTSSIRENLHKCIDEAGDKKVKAICKLPEDEIVDIGQYNKDIDDAEIEIAGGEFYSQDQVKKKIQALKK